MVPPPPQTWPFTPLCPLHTNPPPTTWPLNPRIIFVIVVPLPANMALHSVVSITYEPPPHNLASQSQNNFHDCGHPLPPQTWPFTLLCPLHTTPPPTTWPLNPGIIFMIVVPPPPKHGPSLFCIHYIQTPPPQPGLSILE